MFEPFVQRDPASEVGTRLATGQAAPSAVTRTSQALSQIEAFDRTMGKTETESRAAAQAIADKAKLHVQAVLGELDGVKTA